MHRVVQNDDGTHLLQRPDLRVNLAVFNSKKLPVYRIVDKQVHVLSLSFRHARRGQLFIDRVDAQFDVLQILLLESLVLEQRVSTVISQLDSERVQELLEHVSVHQSRVDLLAEFLHFFKHLFVHVELFIISLHFSEHLSELLPIVTKSCIFLNDEVNNMQI